MSDRGGLPRIAHSRPWITAADLSSVEEACRSEWIAHGERTSRFEAALSDWVGGAAGAATGSGTAAVALALRALGLEPGDEVVLPTYTCRSVAVAVVAAGGVPVLADVGTEWSMTATGAERAVTSRTRAIVVPHVYGLFADVASFRRFGVPLVEDCAQAIGARRAPAIGGDLAAFSFHPTKCLTTGEGGMVVAAELAIAEKARRLRGGAPDAVRAGVFAPLSDLAAGLGLAQLARYSEALERRRSIAARYAEALDGLVDAASWRVPGAMHFRVVVERRGGLERFGSAFAERGIAVRRGVDELLHRELGGADDQFPGAVERFERTISLPAYPALSDGELERCVATSRAIFSER